MICYRPATSSHSCPLPPLPCSTWLRATGLGISKTPGCWQTQGGPSITSVKSRRQRWRWEDKIQGTKMFVWVTFKILFLDIQKYGVSKHTTVYTTAGLSKPSGRLSGKGTGLEQGALCRPLCHTTAVCPLPLPGHQVIPWKTIPLAQAHGFPTFNWKTLSLHEIFCEGPRYKQEQRCSGSHGPGRLLPRSALEFALEPLGHRGCTEQCLRIPTLSTPSLRPF